MANEFKVKKGLIVDGVNTVLDIQGTQGQLFSVTDSLTGDLFSVSDVSGVPILNVNSSGAIDVDGTIESTGNITCHKDAPKIILKDIGTGNAMTSEFSFHDGNGVSRGYVGYGSSGNSTMYWQNTLGDLQLHTSSALCLTLSGTSATFAGNVDVDGGTLNVGGSNEVSIVSSGSSHFPSLKVNNNGFLGSASVTDALKLLSSGDLQAKTKIGIGIDPTTLLHIKGTGDAIRVESTNTGAGGAQVDLLHFTTSPADEDTFGVINMGGYYAGTTSVYGTQIKSIWTDVSERHSKLEFTTCDTTLSTALTLAHDNSATFAGNVTLSSTAPILYLDNTTATTGKNWRLSSAANGKMYITQDGVVDAITLDHTSGNATFAGTIAASNFSGSSEGANTGDQTLPTIASLGAVTISTAQTVTGAKDFNNTGNYHNGHLFYRAYNAAGVHYPHFLDGGDAGGTTVNWRQYYGTNYKTHQWASDASGNMTFSFQGNIDANNGDISADNFSGSSHGTNTGDGARDYSVGDEIVAAHEHEEVHADSSNAYRRMGAITIAKNGTLSVKFEAYIASGTYYWSYVIARNNSTNLDLVAPLNQLVSHAFTQGLASGVNSAVHVSTAYDVDVGGLVAGDQVELWMRSSTAGGGQVTGNGQQLRAKKFRISASAPTVESNAYLHGTTTISDVSGDERYGGESWSKYLTFDAADSGGGGMVWNKQGSTTYNRGILSNHSDLQFVRSTDDGNNGSIIKDMIIEADGDVTIGLPAGTHHNYGGRTLAIGGTRATLSLVSTGSLTTIALSANGTVANDIHLNHNGANGALGFYQYSRSGETMKLGDELLIKAGSTYVSNTAVNIKLTNGGHRGSELASHPSDASSITHYFENYAGGNVKADGSARLYDRVMEFVCKGSPDGTYGESVFKFKANTIASGVNPTEIMRIIGSGKVGINTISPKQSLDILGDVRIKDSRGLFFKRHGDDYAWRMRNESSSNASTYGFNGTNDLVFEVVSNSGADNAPSATSHSVYASSANTLVLKESGNIGIGTQTAGAKLVIATAAGASTQLRLQRADGAETGQIYMDSSDDLTLSNTGGSGDVILYPHPTSGIARADTYQFRVRKDWAGLTQAIIQNNTGAGASAKLEISVGEGGSNDPTVSYNVGNGGFDWSTGVDNSDGDSFKIAGGTDSHNVDLGTNTRLTIPAEGGLDIQGTVGQLFSVTNDLTGDLFSVSDISGIPIFNVNASGAVDVDGTLTSTGDVVAYSDERLKTNIETLDGSKVYDMRGVSFTKDNKKSSGVIAQELEKIAPELVNNDSQFKAVAYGNITGYLIEAIKELKLEIEQLKKQIK